MSHVVTIKSQVKDPAAIGLACRRLTLPEPIFGPTKLFSDGKTGWAVQLPNWLKSRFIAAVNCSLPK